MAGARRTRLTKKGLKERFGAVKLLSLDVDGILTDGGMYYLDNGQQLRKFNSKDGMGIKMVLAAGIQVCWITASDTPAIFHRAKGLGVPHMLGPVEDKLEALQGLVATLGIGLSEVAHMGDDLNDLPVLDAVGCPLTAADGIEQARARALYVTERPGGDGAVREVCDLLLAARRG